MKMRFLRRMLKMPWTARITNREVLTQAGVRRLLMTTIRRRILRFLVRALRREGLEKVFCWAWWWGKG